MNRLLQHEDRILEAFSETLLPPTNLLTDSPQGLGLTDRIKRHVTHLSPKNRAVFRVTLWLLEIGGLFYRGKLFTALSAGQREAYFHKWHESFLYPIRLLYKFVEAVVYLNYYAHPNVSQKLGFTPPPARPRAHPLSVQKIPDSDLCLDTEVCVIGSGAGGAVIAKELSEKEHSVVLLEEGGVYETSDFGREPLEIVQKIYRNAGMQVTMGLPCVLVPTGKAVGGTTVINSGTCFRLPHEVLEHWQTKLGLQDITEEELLPYYERVEKALHVQPVGEEVLGNNSKIFQRGLEKLGHHGHPLKRNVSDCKGAGMCCFGCPNEAKQSVNLSYVPQAVQNGTKLFANCRVEQIIPKTGHGNEGGGEVIARFVSSEGVDSGKTLRVTAKVIVIAAGTFNTPYLLKKSGIISHNRHIGRHLTIHPCAKVTALFDEVVRGWEGVPQGFYYDGFSKEGIILEGIFTPPSFGSVTISMPPREHKQIMEQYDRTASFGVLVSDEGRGWIRWLPNGDPIIYYSLKRKEVRKIVKAIRFITEVYFAAGAKRVFTGIREVPEVGPGTDLNVFDRRIRRNDLLLTAFHPLGTCRMGRDAGDSVVNSVGEVHGVKNLFIADGSIFPSPLKVNPQEAIMAFATRTADFIDRNRL